MPSARFVAYLRVLTQRQGASGLGLEAQRQWILAHVGDPARLVGEHVEVESGRRNDRPQLAAALAACRVQQGTLLIAKLDRLAEAGGTMGNPLYNAATTAADETHASWTQRARLKNRIQ